MDRIPLNKKRTIFGRQQPTCDYVLDHPSVSRQHAAVVHHKNRSYVDPSFSLSLSLSRAYSNILLLSGSMLLLASQHGQFIWLASQ